MINELINSWQHGNQDAARQLLEYFQTEIFRLTYGILMNTQDAEEATQDSFIYAFNNIDRFDESMASFRTWLHVIAVSRSRDRLRKRRFKITSLQYLFDRGFTLKDQSSTPEERMVSSEQHDRILELMESLSPKIREAIILRFWAGHTFKDMAMIMGCPLPTAQSRVRIGLEQLGEKMLTDQNIFSLV